MLLPFLHAKLQNFSLPKSNSVCMCVCVGGSHFYFIDPKSGKVFFSNLNNVSYAYRKA